MLLANHNYIKFLLIIPLMLTLFGCSLFGPVKTETPTTYVLSAVPHVPTKKSGRQVNIFISPLIANTLYDTNEMAYSIKPYQVDYYVKNQWAEPPAKMLRPLIVKTLQNTHHFHRVTLNSGYGNSDYILNVELIELKQIFSAHCNVIQLSLHAEIINSRTGRVSAAKDINVTERVAAVTPYAAVEAANRAVARALRSLAMFSLRIC